MVNRYKDKTKEKQRQTKMKKATVTTKEKKEKQKKSSAWSNHTEAKQRKLIRSEKKTRRRIAILEAKQHAQLESAKRQSEEMDDWKEFRRDSKRLN